MREPPILPPLPAVCPHCGQVNIPERTICKRCRARLPDRIVTTTPSQPAPAQTIYQVALPVIPRPIVALLLVIFIGPLLVGLVLMGTRVLAALLGGLLLIGCARYFTWPTRVTDITLTITADWLDYCAPRVHITTTWANVALLRGAQEIILTHPAAGRVTPPRFYRTSSLDQWACAIPLSEFESNDQAAIIRAVKQYAPHVTTIPVIEEEDV
jgi:hypothetical protein